MGVKSTVTLTRAEAEERFAGLLMDYARTEAEKMVRRYVQLLSDVTLEQELESLDDKMCGGESFRNYLIGADHGN